MQLTKTEFEDLIRFKKEEYIAKLKVDLAISEFNLSNMNLKYFILSLYRKYNLSDDATISETDGVITEKEENNG